MVREPQKSRSISSAGYDPEARVLELEFRSGGVYQYDGVPLATWEWFQRASSKTDFVNNIIKPNYPYRNVTERPTATGDDDLLGALMRSLDESQR